VGEVIELSHKLDELDRIARDLANLSEAVRGTSLRLSNWQHEWELKRPDESGRRLAERVDLTDPDTQRELSLKILPDAYFTLTTGSRTIPFFFEYDSGSHGHRVWRDRALAYTAYDRQGLFARRFGPSSGLGFRLLVVTPTGTARRCRCTNLLHTIEQAVGPSRLFLASTVSEVTGQTVLTRIWRQPGSTERHGLLDHAAGRVVVTSQRPALR